MLGGSKHTLTPSYMFSGGQDSQFPSSYDPVNADEALLQMILNNEQ